MNFGAFFLHCFNLFHCTQIDRIKRMKSDFFDKLIAFNNFNTLNLFINPMKTFSLIFIALLMAFTSTQKQTKIVFFGDSITQAGIKPGGYIDVLKQLLTEKNLKDQYQLIGAGISGNKVYDLYLRIEEDVLAHQPDVVVIWIGVNDVWHKQSSGTGTDLDKFERFYTAIIKKLQSSGAQVVLATPAVIGERTDMSNQLDGDLNRYTGSIRDLAAKFDCKLVDLRKEFLDYNLKTTPKIRNRASSPPIVYTSTTRVISS